MTRQFVDYLGKEANMPKKNKKVDYVEELAQTQEDMEFNQEDVLVAKDEVPVNINMSNTSTTMPPPAEVPPSVTQTNHEVSDDVLASIALMLNQIMEELNVINQKIDAKAASLESAQVIPQKPLTRKITLDKDANGKWVAVVVDSANGE